MWWIGILVALAIGTSLVWAISRAVKIVGPAEMAIKVTFGTPVAFCDSGWVVDPRLIFGRRFKCFLQRFPKKMFKFEYREREVITQAGEYETAGTGKRIYYGAQTLKVDSVAYLNFPRDERGKETTGDELLDTEMTKKKKKIKGVEELVEVEATHPLIKILRSQVPTDDEGLKGWTDDAVLGALRVAFGQMTWMQAVVDIKKVTGDAENVFKSKDGALIRAGFSKKGIQLVIAEIKLPPGLQQAMPNVDRQRLEADAARFEAKERSFETVGAVIEMIARSRGKESSEITAEIEKSEELKREFLDISKDLVTREMGIEGKAYFDIRTSGETSIEESIILKGLAAFLRLSKVGDKEGREESDKEKKEGGEDLSAKAILKRSKEKLEAKS